MTPNLKISFVFGCIISAPIACVFIEEQTQEQNTGQYFTSEYVKPEVLECFECLLGDKKVVPIFLSNQKILTFTFGTLLSIQFIYHFFCSSKSQLFFITSSSNPFFC